ncbi:hypothetical protein [Spirosoma utsteinense]|uniref:hypothetical protein n=1 Tax=Spirosoma utsteinense TaxID=2585773 RepID=UPI00164879BA|nr:hypothetical protein [Spirosoma utsteinense]MBC3786531.1 hypothetical protein [Spirosoma utsteinense]
MSPGPKTGAFFGLPKLTDDEKSTPARTRAPFVEITIPPGTTPSSFTQNFNSLPSTGNLGISSSTAGLVGYLLKVSTQRQSETVKVIKQ